MARVNQGYYKKLKKEYDEVIASAELLEDETYDENECLQGDYVTCWDNMCESNEIYQQCCKVSNKLNDMLSSQKFEDEKKKEKYQKWQRNIEEKKSRCEEIYNEIRSALGEDLSDAERRTINDFELEKQR